MTTTRRLVAWFVVPLAILGMSLDIAAQAPTPVPDGKAPPLAELDALRIEKLVAERRALEERFGRLQAEAKAAQSEASIVQELWQAKARELDQVVEAAALKVPGVTDAKAWLKRYRPELGANRWKAVAPEAKP